VQGDAALVETPTSALVIEVTTVTLSKYSLLSIKSTLAFLVLFTMAAVVSCANYGSQNL
jgi:hypothetical protein